MTSRERLRAALDGRPADHVPLTTWCFGFPAPAELRWQTAGRDVRFWYSKRLEHIHTLPQPWELDDEFRRAAAWLALGVDDVLDVSVPWSHDPTVAWRDEVLPPGAADGDARYPVLVREYQTPAGALRHAVRKTEPDPAGWPVQSDHVPLCEDFNIPRAVQHVVREPAHVPAVGHLFAPPDAAQRRWFAERVACMKAYADAQGLLVQAWAAFGIDAAVWFMGAERAVLMAMDAPQAFGRLLDLIFQTDLARTELAATTAGVDVVCQRGWYSSTDFWSPALFDQLVAPRLKQLTAVAHREGKKFAYVMTTGVARLGPRLADAGVDLLYFADPIQDRLPLETARQLCERGMTLAGGTNALSLATGDRARIRQEVRRALEVLGPTQRFILHPVDALFPDTPWAGVAAMIEAWKEFQAA
jgi:hypothetical protein